MDGVTSQRDAALVEAGLTHARYSGADLAQALLARRAGTTVGAGKDAARLIQMASEEQSDPEVFGISHASLAAAGGDDIEVYGRGFTGATGVTLKGVAATSVVVVNPNKITCTSAAAAAGTGDVVVTTPNGTGTLEDGAVYA